MKQRPPGNARISHGRHLSSDVERLGRPNGITSLFRNDNKRRCACSCLGYNDESYLDGVKIVASNIHLASRQSSARSSEIVRENENENVSADGACMCVYVCLWGGIDTRERDTHFHLSGQT